MIIDQWNGLKKREREQVLVLKKAIGELDLAIKSYARGFKRAENVEKNEATKKAMEKAANNIRILMGVFKFDLKDLKSLLSKEEYRNIEFA